MDFQEEARPRPHSIKFAKRALAVTLLGAAGLVIAAVSTGFGAAGAVATTSSGTTIVSISTNSCGNGSTGGTLTVSGAVTGETVTLGLFGKNPHDGKFSYVGNTTTIDLVSGQSTYSYSISLSSLADSKKILRVQVVSTSGGSFTGTTTKGPSFQCGELSTPTPTPTSPTPVPTSPTPA